MCNLAGYVGDEPAAPILLDMMERQEGMAGGFYSGVATVADGELRYAKVIGDFARLRRETDAERLPGTVGIAHSRSNSGGDLEWGHPFLNCDGKLAYVANGGYGIFNNADKRNRVARNLVEAGHRLRSRAPEAVGKYPLLADGSCVHMSDAMCHLIGAFMAESRGPAQAMRRAFHKFPSEIVGLMLHADYPDRVVATRINQPLMIGRSKGATFMASAAVAFPGATADWLMPMPINATASVYADHVDILPFDTPPGPVARTIPWREGEKRVWAALQAGEPAGTGALRAATKDLWPENMATQSNMMVYEILRGLIAQGAVEFVVENVEGTLPGTYAPLMKARLVEPV